MQKNKKGFTLIELIVVIAILAILVLIAGLRFMDHIAKAELAHIKNDTKVVGSIVQEYLVSSNELPDTWAINNSVDLETKITERKVYSVEGEVVNSSDLDGTTSGYKIIDKAFIDERANTKLSGSFITNSNGEVYYISETAIGGANNNIKPEDDLCPAIPAGEMKPIDMSMDTEFTTAEGTITLQDIVTMIPEDLPDGEEVLHLSYRKGEDIYFAFITYNIDESRFILSVFNYDIFDENISSMENMLEGVNAEKFLMLRVSTAETLYIDATGNIDLFPSYLQKYDESGHMDGCPIFFKKLDLWKSMRDRLLEKHR